jgi:transcriptional regulator with XRE-family HTH domain
VGKEDVLDHIAADAAVDRAYMSRLERELENPTVTLLDRLAKALSAHISEFFNEPKAGEPRPRPLPGGRHARQLRRTKKW